MGVPSGFGTFRGITASKWKPLLEHPQWGYTDIASPDWFNKSQGNSSTHDTVNFAYAFWVDQSRQYSSNSAHQGYSIAKKWSQLDHIKLSFSFTSNVCNVFAIVLIEHGPPMIYFNFILIEKLIVLMILYLFVLIVINYLDRMF